ncbi:hypothetical protein IW262DRAFT_1462837 [Armillaria fumosa]|nr:hypothetical protein IW262DRAFT_1462837 [Armillaria fumosa]
MTPSSSTSPIFSLLQGTRQMGAVLASQRFTRRRTRSIDARSVGLNQSQKTRSRPVLVVFDDGRIHICDVHLKPGDNKGTLSRRLLCVSVRQRAHSDLACAPSMPTDKMQDPEMYALGWGRHSLCSGCRELATQLTEWTIPLLVDIYSGSKVSSAAHASRLSIDGKLPHCLGFRPVLIDTCTRSFSPPQQVVTDFDDGRLQINGLHPDAGRKWAIKERTRVDRNHRLPNQGRGTDGAENPPKVPRRIEWDIDVAAVQGHWVIVAMSSIAGSKTGLRWDEILGDTEGNIDVGFQDIGSLAHSDSLPVLDQEVNTMVSHSNFLKFRTGGRNLCRGWMEAAILLCRDLRASLRVLLMRKQSSASATARYPP